MTFARACSHFSNFTAAHESRGLGRIGDDRFAYPDDHIEVDNRLSWFTGELAERFDSAEVLYVHLVRDVEETALSFLKRWDSDWRASIISAFAHGILKQPHDWSQNQVHDVCRFYVESVHANIRTFVSQRPSFTFHIASAPEAFRQFADLIGAQGDLDSATSEWTTKHNAS